VSEAPPTAAIVGRPVRELMLPQQSIIVPVGPGRSPRVPTSETKIMAEDEVLAVTRTENEDAAARRRRSRQEGPGISDPGYGPSQPGPYDPASH
jgi:Trk K+ transport system NAD-binding subunit